MKTLSVKLFTNRINIDLPPILTYVYQYNHDRGIELHFDISPIDVHGYTSVYTQVRPGIWYWILNGAEKLISDTTHDITIFMFDQNEWKSLPGSHYPLTPNVPTSDTILVNNKPFINLGFYSPDTIGNEIMFCHELMHVYTKLANAQGLTITDQMDTYYLNNDLTNPLSNFGVQWRLLSKWIQQMPTIQQSTLNLIESFEGFRAVPYKDTSGIWTIGYGATYLAGVPVTANTIPITQVGAESVLKLQVQHYADAVTSAIKIPLTQNQFDACVSLCYNIGTGGFTSSTVCHDINVNNFQGAADAFLLWDRSGGSLSQGLLNRREKERQVFLTV